MTIQTASIQTANSTKPLAGAVADLQAAFEGHTPRLMLVFASSNYDTGSLMRRMQDAFPNTCVAGCSTAGEIAAGKMLTGSVAAMAFGSDIVSDVAAVTVERLSAGIDLSTAFQKLEDHFHAPRSAWDIGKYVGLVLIDGLSGAEEKLLEKLGDATDIFFVGGSAGDDLKFQATHVFAAGRALSDAAVLVVLRLERGFEIIKTQSFRSTGKSLVATSVDEAHRTVREFNHKPALQAYAEALGVSPAEAREAFFKHPLGLMVDGAPFVRSPQKADGNAMIFYCNIKENTGLEVLEGTDIVADTRRDIAARESREIRGLIDFHCILRTLQLRQENRCDQYGEIFRGIPMAGFSTYGEAYLGHLNQTSTILLFH
jgi:hypothetical protein